MTYRYHYGPCGHYAGVFPPRHHDRLSCPRCRSHDTLRAKARHDRLLRWLVVLALLAMTFCLAAELGSRP